MPATAPLIISQSVEEKLRQLQQIAAASPIDVSVLDRVLASKPGRDTYRQQLRAQSVIIPGPFAFVVTYSIETGHQQGAVRHLSMSVNRPRRAPSPEAVWMVAQILGFRGDLMQCQSWPETIEDDAIAVNLVQPVARHT